MNIERKSYPISGLKADDQTGIVEAIVSVFNNVDSGKEIVRPGFFTKSIAKKLPKGVWAHDWKQPIAKTLEAKELAPGDPMLPDSLKELGGTYIKAQFNLDTQRGREAHSDIKFGTIDEFSIGYKVTKESKDETTGARELLEGDWKEWSPVLVGMNDQTHLISVKSAEAKGLFEDTIEEREESLCFLFDALSSAIYRAQMMSEMGTLPELGAAIDEILAEFSARVKDSIVGADEPTDDGAGDTPSPGEGGSPADAAAASYRNTQTATMGNKPISFKGDLRAGSTFANHTKSVLAAVEVFANKGAALAEFISEFNKRSEGIMETRFKDGRMYSSSNLSQMQRVHGAMGKLGKDVAAIHSDMGTLIQRAQKPEKSDIESLRTQSLRLQSLAIAALN